MVDDMCEDIIKAVQVLIDHGIFETIGPGMGRQYTGLDVHIENRSDENIHVIILGKEASSGRA